MPTVMQAATRPFIRNPSSLEVRGIKHARMTASREAGLIHQGQLPHLDKAR
jgi:hypothetical protein